VRLPDALIDTYIGRRPDQAIEVMKGYLDQNVVGHVVVYACFSNTTASAEQLEEMIEIVGEDREVYLVGTVNPDGFQDQANELLQEAADGHDNVHYVDWPEVLEGHLKEYLWADDTHLRPEGAEVYVDMVTRAVAQAMVDAGGTTTEEE
jgi:flavin-binding protein dodecin